MQSAEKGQSGAVGVVEAMVVRSQGERLFCLFVSETAQQLLIGTAADRGRSGWAAYWCRLSYEYLVFLLCFDVLIASVSGEACLRYTWYLFSKVGGIGVICASN